MPTTSVAQVIAFLLPYEFSPTVLLVCGTTALLFYRGRRRVATGHGRAAMFWLGLGLTYFVLQTHYDYYAQHMFFMHRLQHLILHDFAPFLLALAAPAEALAAGLPEVVRLHLVAPSPVKSALRHVYRALQQPLVAALLFVGPIYLWLTPQLHFYAMLNVPLYDGMNWSVTLDGLLFWWVMFNLRAAGGRDANHFGGRILVLFVVMLPESVIGAHVALSHRELYDVYRVCGRAWPLSPDVDQQIGGLITWIPPSLLCIAGALVLLRRWRTQCDGENGRREMETISGGGACRNDT